MAFWDDLIDVGIEAAGSALGSLFSGGGGGDGGAAAAAMAQADIANGFLSRTSGLMHNTRNSPTGTGSRVAAAPVAQRRRFSPMDPMEHTRRVIKNLDFA